jgi:hypothetical protein
MIHHFKGPLIALASIFGFLGLLAFQDPMTTTLPDGTTIKQSLPEIAAGCQPLEKIELDTYPDQTDITLARINPPDSDFDFVQVGNLVNNGNMVILYDNEIGEVEYGELREAGLISLTDNLTPLYLVPYTGGDWETRGLYELYGINYRQECVESDSEVFNLFWDQVSQ